MLRAVGVKVTPATHSKATFFLHCFQTFFKKGHFFIRENHRHKDSLAYGEIKGAKSFVYPRD